MQNFETKEISLSKLRNNTGQIKGLPKNPRQVKDARFDNLKKSIQDAPEMLGLRELLVVPFDDVYVVIGGNMRLRALKDLKHKTAHCKIINDATPEKLREYAIKDNENFGEYDWDVVANEWDDAELKDWGVELPVWETEPNMEDLIADAKNKPATLKITFESPEQLQKAEIDIQELIDRKYKGAYFSVSAGEL